METPERFRIESEHGILSTVLFGVLFLIFEIIGTIFTVVGWIVGSIISFIIVGFVFWFCITILPIFLKSVSPQVIERVGFARFFKNNIGFYPHLRLYLNRGDISNTYSGGY